MTQNTFWTSSALKHKIIKTDIHFQFKIILLNLFYFVFVFLFFFLFLLFAVFVLGHRYMLLL